MTQSNAAIVRSILAFWERGELSSLEWAAPEIEFVFADGPEPGRHVGREAMKDLFRGWLGSFAEFGISVEDVIDLDLGRVLALTSVRGQEGRAVSTWRAQARRRRTCSSFATGG